MPRRRIMRSSPHAEFVRNALRKGIQVGRGDQEYKDMELSREQAFLIETQRLINSETRKRMHKGRQPIPLEALKKIAADNIKRIYGE